MKKLMLFTLLLLHAGFFVAAQQNTIVQWNFNSTFTIPANGVGPSPSTGAGTINLTGGTTATNANGIIPTDGPAPGNQALNTVNYPTQNLPANRKTAGIIINANTSGYNSIHLTYYTQHSNTAANTIVVQYFDGSTWQDIVSYTVSTGGTFLPQKDIDLSSIAALNNSTNVQLKIVTDFGNGTAYLPTNSTSYAGGAAGGTIRYDLITITGNPIGCVNPATQQATGLRLLKTDATSTQLMLNRGNGGGCLVMCSASGVPSVTPVSGTNYSANSNYGSGAALGNAYAVYNTQTGNPATHYFNINGLTAGTKYYLAAYEYSGSGFCYLTPALIDSFYCNSTVLYPGDLQFVGFDNFAGAGGRDAFVITNFKALTKGTYFRIVNSRFEAGAAANVRTNKWYSGNNDPFQDLQWITITYIGAGLAAGSVISFDHLPQNAGSIKINNVTTSDLAITDNFNIGNLLSGTAPEQFFLTQGKFSTYGLPGIDEYHLLDGHVLHGITYTNNWVSFNQACSAGNTISDRQSRLPPDIKCINLYVGNNTNFGYFLPSAAHSGSQAFLLSQINNLSNWGVGPGTNSNEIPSAALSIAYNILTSNPGGRWTGSTSNDWFNCQNWEGLFVPDSTIDATVQTVMNSPVIDVNNTNAAEYNNQAITKALSVTNSSVTLSGSSADKLTIYDSLLIGNAANLTTTGGVDSIIVRGNITCQNSNGLQLSSNGWLSLQGNRQLKSINVMLTSTTTPVNVYALSLNNPPGISVNNGGLESLQKLELASGILSFGSVNAFHYLGAACAISSPTNYFGEVNKGWENSYINGKVYVRTNSKLPYTAPVGSKQKGVFAPLILQPDSSVNRLYVVEYFGSPHPNIAPGFVNTPPIDHVSSQEYWTLSSPNPNAAAKVTLYFTPLSFVAGLGGTAPNALVDLQVVQYWDSSANNLRKWRFFGNGGFTYGGNTQYGHISSNEYATSLLDADKNFTLGTRSTYNTLPAQLLSWKASLQNNRTQLEWLLKDENDIAFYTVEKSTDGKNFHFLQTVDRAMLSGKNYSCFDNYLINGWNYYRLKLTDKSGRQTYSSIEKVWSKPSPTFRIFPNPASDVLYVSLPQATSGTITIYTGDGKKCMQQVVKNVSFTQLNVGVLSSGWYLLEYSDSKIQLKQKLFIK